MQLRLGIVVARINGMGGQSKVSWGAVLQARTQVSHCAGGCSEGLFQIMLCFTAYFTVPAIVSIFDY